MKNHSLIAKKIKLFEFNNSEFEPETIGVLQKNILKISPNLLPKYGVDSKYGTETRNAINIILSFASKHHLNPPMTSVNTLTTDAIDYIKDLVETGYTIKYTRPNHVNKTSKSPHAYLKEDELETFITTAERYAALLTVPVRWLYNIIWIESKYDPKAINKQGYGGLIGFGKAAATDLGTTVDYIRMLSATEQLYYVYLYFKRKKKTWNSFNEFYGDVFYPLMGKKDNNYVIGSERSPEYVAKVAVGNPAFDLNKDKILTKSEFNDYVNINFKEA